MAGTVGGRKQVDIEDLLRWAYVEELPKVGVSASSGLDALLDYGTAIDDSYYSNKMPIAAGDPHPDALMLDYKVRALDPMQFSIAMARHLLGDLAPYLRREVSKTMTGMFRRGKRDVGGIVVAERIEHVEEVNERTVRPAALIAIHAKLGNRPNWDVGASTLSRVTGSNGKPVVHGITRGGRYAEGAHCPLKLEPSAETIARARFDYSVWWTGLMTLAETCRLDHHIVLRPRAAAQPWVTGEVSTSRVLRTIRPTHSGLTTSPTAAC